MSSDDSRRALEAFIAKNPDLARLESLLSRFNVFEAIGAVRHELRHSDFLSYLLDPSQNHGLEAVFLKELLQAVLMTTESKIIVSLFDLDFWNLSQAVVQREWHHVDILVLDEVNRFAVIIENKIDTEEHSDQLNRYLAQFHRNYPGFKAVGLYLTPDGVAPSSDAYHPVSYLLVCQIIEKIVSDRRSTLGGEVVMVLEHYAQMLRRHIVSESEVAELCSRIYQKHRQALDLIFEHRPDQRAQVGQYAKSLVLGQPELKFTNQGRHYVNFELRDWDKSALYRGEIPNRVWLLYFSFLNMPNSLTVGLWVGPGDDTDRARLLRMAQSHNFTGCRAKIRAKWSHLSLTPILSASDYDKTQVEIETLISEKWEAFLRDELPRMSQAIREEQWLWDPNVTLPSLPVSRHGIREFVKRLIAEAPELKLYNDGAGFVNFGLSGWDVPGNYRWRHENGFWLVHFNFVNNLADLTICLGVEPGDETDRNTLLQMVQGHGFTGTRSTELQKSWSALTSFPVLSAGDYGITQEEAEALISEKWDTYLRDELLRIVQAIRD